MSASYEVRRARTYIEHRIICPEMGGAVRGFSRVVCIGSKCKMFKYRDVEGNKSEEIIGSCILKDQNAIIAKPRRS